MKANSRNWKWPLIAVLGILIISCQHRTFDSKVEMMAYVTDPENGYVQYKTINGVDFSITYRPTDLVVQQMLNDNYTKKELDSLRNKYKDFLYLNVTLGKNGQEVLNGMANDRAQFGAMVNQLAFGMDDKVHLFDQSRDTVVLLDYSYPRFYGMGGPTNLLFVYPRAEKLMGDDFFHFTIEDIGLDTGEVGFKMPIAPLLKEPKLKL